jgi:hypothetical protein
LKSIYGRFLSLHLKTIALNVRKSIVKSIVDRVAVGLDAIPGIAITAIQNGLPSSSVQHQRTAAAPALSIELIHLPSFSQLTYRSHHTTNSSCVAVRMNFGNKTNFSITDTGRGKEFLIPW